jgi:hypothetical protein
MLERVMEWLYYWGILTPVYLWEAARLWVLLRAVRLVQWGEEEAVILCMECGEFVLPKDVSLSAGGYEDSLGVCASCMVDISDEEN